MIRLLKEDVNSDLEYLMNTYEQKNIKSWVYFTGKYIELSEIQVPKEMRDQGLGTQFMEDLIKIADNYEYVITLTPTSDYGGSIPRLIKFYKSLDFVMNKGRNKNYEYRDTMYRIPQ